MIAYIKTAHFDESEFYCKCRKCKGKIAIPMQYRSNLKRLIDMLEIARTSAGIPFAINSGYRCKDHPESKKIPDSAHTTAEACDISVDNSSDRFTVVDELLKAGFLRLGMDKTYIHCDVSRTLDQKVLWLYQT